ncbi:MAG: VCBS domain-containing protein, partial [Betaproteobacteria bacterium]
ITISYEVVETDSTGNELGRTQTSVAISIQGQNDAAAVGAVTIATDEDQANDVIDLLGNSSDPDATDGLSVENLTYIAGDDSGVVVNSDGTLSLNPNQYTGLAEGETETIEYTYDVVERDTSGNELSRNTTSVSITVAGRNDVAVISVDLDDPQLTVGAPYDRVAGGTISVVDADNNQSNILTQTASFGSVSIVDGQFEYVLDPGRDFSSTTTDTITFTAIDGTQTSVDVKIFTQNFPALLNIDANTTDYVLSSGAPGVTTLSGTYTLQDAEGAVLLAPLLSYGTFTQVLAAQASADGVTEAIWSYSVDTANIAVLGLDEGETLTEVISFATDDARDIDGDNVVLDVESGLDADSIYTRDSDIIEGRQVIEVVIRGQNDAPVIGWSTLVTDQNVSIDSAAGEGLLTFVSDPDNADGSVTDLISISGVAIGASGSGAGSAPGTTLVGRYGSLLIQADGAFTYTPDEAAQSLALENALFVDDEVFTVSVSDGTTVSQASLVIEIRNPPPKLETAPLSYVTVSDDANIVIQFSDLDAFTIQAADREAAEGLPIGLTATLTADGQIYSGSNLSTATISGQTLQSTNGDWVLGVTADDGDNVSVTDQFILAVRSPTILTSPFQVYEFFEDESELAAAYSTSGYLDVSLWEPRAGDRLVSVTSGTGAVSVALYGNNGVTVSLDSPTIVIFPSNAAQDVVTVTGSLSELQVFGAQTGDILVANADLVIGGSGTNPFELHVGATLSINSSGSGTQAGFNNAADGTVGETRGAALSFDAISVLDGGAILIQPDDQPAAPYLAAGALTNQGRILISGYAENGPDQPSLLQVAEGTNQTGTFAQTVTGETKISTGGELQADNVQNEGVIRLVSSVDDGLDQTVSFDDGFSVARLTVLDTYSGNGSLVSESLDPTAIQAYSFQNLQAPNEVDVLVFTLDPGGHIQVDADLDFVNVSQTLDWRQGSIDIAPDADLTIRGGTVVFGSASLVTGYGELALGASNTSTQTLDTVTLAIDGELNSNQFQGEVSFHGAVTLTTYGTTSQVATLIISSGDEIMLDG